MKLRIPEPIKAIAFTSIVLLFVGCAKNSTTIIYGDEEETGLPGSPSKGNALVTFNASIEGRNITRSMSPMKKGVKSHLYAYLAPTGAISQETPSAIGIYVTSTPGVLAGADGYKMYLSNGTYNFYAVSDNYSTIPPTFYGKESEPLFNGIDYLWWGSQGQDVASSQVNIPIVFKHSGTQVVIEVSAGESLVLNKLISATITPAEPGATMTLTTGVIEPTTTYDRPDKMGIKSFTAQYIMLPLETSDPMKLTLEVLADGETTTRTYNGLIPVPDGELMAGNSYVFSAIIDEDAVSFPSVSVKDWTEVDETGNPLYPSQK